MSAGPAQTTQTHDYTLRTWGHNYNIVEIVDGGQQLRLAGWGRGLRVGDYLLLQNGEGSTRYQVGDDLRYERDPGDMWWCTATFAPRS